MLGDSKKLIRKGEVELVTVHMRGMKEYGSLGRKIVARWLREKAKDLERDGNEYAPTFTARFVCPKR